MAHKLYWESQKGNLCRLHSLNVFYKNLDLGSKLTEKEFYYYCDLFDKYMDFDIKTIDNDTFSATQMNIISFILWQKSGLYTILIAPYQLKKELNWTNYTWEYVENDKPAYEIQTGLFTSLYHTFVQLEKIAEYGEFEIEILSNLEFQD